MVTFLHNERETIVNGYDSKGSNAGAVAEILGDVYIKSAEVDCRHIQAFPVDTMKTLVSIRLDGQKCATLSFSLLPKQSTYRDRVYCAFLSETIEWDDSDKCVEYFSVERFCDNWIILFKIWKQFHAIIRCFK